MEMTEAVEALSALAQSNRLAVFKLLIRMGEGGLPAGEIARKVGVVPNTLSTHLAILEAAGLIRSRREGRSVIYSADFAGMRDLLGYLVADCCAGRPEICAPLSEIVTNCCERSAA